METLRISAKALGGFAQEGYCKRCMWIKLHAKDLPWQIFPGIFASIDAYTKKIVHGYFDRHDKAPEFLADLGSVTGYVDPPSHHHFKFHDEETGILLTGEADGIFRRPDDSHVIVDYKTARFTTNQEGLFPIYEAQLNGYAVIAEETGISPVSGLALIYFEPETQASKAYNDAMQDDIGFRLGFDANVQHLPLRPDLIRSLLQTAREQYDSPFPAEEPTCGDCDRWARIIDLTS